VIPSALTTTGIIDESHFKPEFANAYELGVKGVYLDGKARVNVAGFWTNFEDFQLNTFNGLGFTIANVGKVTTKGVELETTLVPTEGFVTTFGVTFADARYDKSNTIIFPITLPNGAASAVPAANKNLTNAPRWTGSLGVNYEHTLPQTEWVGYLGGNVRYSSKRNTGSNLHPFKVEPHHFFLNMNVGVRSPDGHWDAQLWANNLTDEYENNIIFDSVFQTGSQGTFFNAPRMWGATLKYNFGDRE
jgi:outer membrane receptor protein involved in Fe transport